MREFRLQRLVDQLQQRDYGGLLLFDPLNIRYATDTTNMQLWITHNPARACFVSAEGYIVLFDFHSCEHLSEHLPLVREVRGGASFFYFESADRGPEHAAKFASTINQLMQQACRATIVVSRSTRLKLRVCVRWKKPGWKYSRGNA